jgi:DNA polymerase-1
MTSTVTGRRPSFHPNLQNVPRDPRVRSAVAAPPGYLVMDVDYSQIELRVAAELAGPTSALFAEYCTPNPDVHLTMAQWLTGKERSAVTDEERSRAKPPNFAYLYLADEPTYIRIALTDYDRSISEQEARDAKAAFSRWGLTPWYDDIRRQLRDTGEVTTLFGRKRRLPNWNARDKYARLEALRMGVNFSDQALASDIMALALTELVGQSLETQLFWPFAEIHDSALCYVRDDAASIAHATSIVKHALEVTVPNLIEQLFGYRLRVPLQAGVTVGRWWGDKEHRKALDTTGIA